jgi:hypothetical protein
MSHSLTVSPLPSLGFVTCLAGWDFSLSGE